MTSKNFSAVHELDDIELDQVHAVLALNDDELDQVIGGDSSFFIASVVYGATLGRHEAIMAGA